MKPRLLVVAGPLRDSTFFLTAEETAVGRDSSNTLAVSDPSLSRRHCLILNQKDQCTIRDLESRNGTFVNGIPVTESPLQQGDQISVGDSVFVFLMQEEAEIGVSDQVEFEDRPTHATARLRREDLLYLDPERIRSELPAASRIAQNLNALLEISQVIHEIRDLELLQAKILSLIFDVVPAERGAILLNGKTAGEFESVFARHRGSQAALSVSISRTITRQVIEQELAVLGTDIATNTNLSNVESVVQSKAYSVLCAPLTGFQKVLGCIYLDTTNPADRFDKENLQMVAAMARTCAVALENLRRLQWLEQENLRLNTEINLEHNMVGESARMKDVYQFLSRVAPTDATVLIEGESGTGKELVAHAIHRNSPRADKPFIAINCAAIPEGLLESELFGHEKGSFTNAIAQKKGRLEVANGGVVFLDEIGELAPALQVKLLRVLQEREFERIGGTRPIAVDIRLIAATNKNLEDAVKAGAFRLDLFYRLNVVNLVMPPLRERREDIPILANYFVHKYSKKCKSKPKTLSRDTIACLTNYDWPGNVRELENAMERALVLSLSDTLEPEDLPESIVEREPSPSIVSAKYHAAVRELKKRLIQDAVAGSSGNYTVAANKLGVHVNYLHRLLRNLGLREPRLPGKTQEKKYGTDS